MTRDQWIILGGLLFLLAMEALVNSTVHDWIMNGYKSINAAISPNGNGGTPTHNCPKGYTWDSVAGGCVQISNGGGNGGSGGNT